VPLGLFTGATFTLTDAGAPANLIEYLESR